VDIITYALCKKSDREILDIIRSMERLTAEVVEELPPVEEAESNKLYLLDSNHDGTYEVFLKATVGGED
jgi:hypothetical protein